MKKLFFSLCIFALLGIGIRIFAETGDVPYSNNHMNSPSKDKKAFEKIEKLPERQVEEIKTQETVIILESQTNSGAKGSEPNKDQPQTGYYIVDENDPKYPKGCNSEGLPEPEKYCIYSMYADNSKVPWGNKKSGKIFVSPATDEKVLEGDKVTQYCESLDILGLKWESPLSHGGSRNDIVKSQNKIFGLKAKGSEKSGHYRVDVDRQPKNFHINCTLGGNCGSEQGKKKLSVRCISWDKLDSNKWQQGQSGGNQSDKPNPETKDSGSDTTGTGSNKQNTGLNLATTGANIANIGEKIATSGAYGIYTGGNANYSGMNTNQTNEEFDKSRRIVSIDFDKISSNIELVIHTNKTQPYGRSGYEYDTSSGFGQEDLEKVFVKRTYKKDDEIVVKKESLSEYLTNSRNMNLNYGQYSDHKYGYNASLSYGWYYLTLFPAGLVNIEIEEMEDAEEYFYYEVTTNKLDKIGKVTINNIDKKHVIINGTKMNAPKGEVTLIENGEEVYNGDKISEEIKNKRNNTITATFELYSKYKDDCFYFSAKTEEFSNLTKIEAYMKGSQKKYTVDRKDKISELYVNDGKICPPDYFYGNTEEKFDKIVVTYKTDKKLEELTGHIFTIGNGKNINATYNGKTVDYFPRIGKSEHINDIGVDEEFTLKLQANENCIYVGEPGNYDGMGMNYQDKSNKITTINGEDDFELKSCSLWTECHCPKVKMIPICGGTGNIVEIKGISKRLGLGVAKFIYVKGKFTVLESKGNIGLYADLNERMCRKIINIPNDLLDDRYRVEDDDFEKEEKDDATYMNKKLKENHYQYCEIYPEFYTENGEPFYIGFARGELGTAYAGGTSKVLYGESILYPGEKIYNQIQWTKNYIGGNFDCDNDSIGAKTVMIDGKKYCLMNVGTITDSVKVHINEGKKSVILLSPGVKINRNIRVYNLNGIKVDGKDELKNLRKFTIYYYDVNKNKVVSICRVADDDFYDCIEQAGK